MTADSWTWIQDYLHKTIKIVSLLNFTNYFKNFMFKAWRPRDIPESKKICMVYIPIIWWLIEIVWRTVFLPWLQFDERTPTQIDYRLTFKFATGPTWSEAYQEVSPWWLREIHSWSGTTCLTSTKRPQLSGCKQTWGRWRQWAVKKE